jgi:hypothetical protein
VTAPFQVVQNVSPAKEAIHSILKFQILNSKLETVFRKEPAGLGNGFKTRCQGAGLGMMIARIPSPTFTFAVTMGVNDDK